MMMIPFASVKNASIRRQMLTLFNAVCQHKRMTKKYRPPNIKQIIEGLFETIAELHCVKRPENFLSDTFDIEVYGVRQWTVRGVPIDKRDRFAALVGLTRAELDRLHGE